MVQPGTQNAQVGVIDLRLIVQQLWRFSWLIVVMGLGFALLAAAFAVRPAPYEVHATISIEPSGLNEALVSLNDIDIEMGRIRSWTPVHRVIDQMPFYGFVKKHDSLSPWERVERIQKFLKTGKKHEELEVMPIKIEQLLFPSDYHNQRLVMTILENKAYSVKDPDGNILVEGTAGQRPKALPRIAFFVSEINAPERTQFYITPVSEDTMIEHVLTQFKIKKRSTSTKASLIDLNYFSSDPYFALKFTRAIIDDYIANTMERITQSKQQALESMDQELDTLNRQLNESEAALSLFMQQQDVADIDNEMRDRLQLRLSLEQELRKIQLEKAQLRQVYTDNHPAMLALREKEQKLQAKLTDTQNTLQALPKIKGELYTLTRHVEKYQQQYALLLEQTTGLKLETSALTNPATQVNDPRIVLRNLRNKALQIIILGGLMGGIVAFSFIALRANLMAGLLNDTRQLDRYKHLSLRDVSEGQLQEAGRDIASQLIYLSRRKRNNVAMITSHAKSASGNRMILEIMRQFAQVEGPILLIDANMKSTFSEITQEDGKPGFSNLMAGDRFSDAMAQRLDHPNMYYIPPGTPPASLTVLRDFERLDFLLTRLRKLFPCILIDLPGNRELPFWDTLLGKASIVIHLLEKKTPLERARGYLQHANEIAERVDQTIHEVILFPPDLK